MMGEVYKRNTATRDELLSRIMNAAARIKKRKDQLRRTRRNLRSRSAQCIDDDGGIFEHLLICVANWSFPRNKSVI
jgi:predicted phage gp36 major capsid-like protein